LPGTCYKTMFDMSLWPHHTLARRDCAIGRRPLGTRDSSRRQRLNREGEVWPLQFSLFLSFRKANAKRRVFRCFMSAARTTPQNRWRRRGWGRVSHGQRKSERGRVSHGQIKSDRISDESCQKEEATGGSNNSRGLSIHIRLMGVLPQRKTTGFHSLLMCIISLLQPRVLRTHLMAALECCHLTRA